MLNTLDMYGICHEIYRDFKGKSVYEKADENVLNVIFILYNTTEIDCEEIRDLWVEYLTKGSLSISTMIQRAKMRDYKAS